MTYKPLDLNSVGKNFNPKEQIKKVKEKKKSQRKVQEENEAKELLKRNLKHELLLLAQSKGDEIDREEALEDLAERYGKKISILRKQLTRLENQEKRIEEQEMEEEFPEFKDKDPQELLREAYGNISAILDYYMDLPHDVRNIVALWTMGTYFHQEFSTYPYLFINAMRGSGKTRLLKIISSLAWEGMLTSSITESTLFRTVGTICLDEFEGVGGKEKQNLRELLNAGYKKGVKIIRMRKKKTLDGENQVAEEFEPYRPISMANIWGMEEVLGDRCISLLLEKSSDASKIRLIEDFEDIPERNYTKNMLIYTGRCSLCRCSYEKNIDTKKLWNFFIKQSFTTQTTSIPYYTYNYTNYTTTKNKIKIDKETKELFEKIKESEIDGRYLELFFPLMFLAGEIGEDVLNQTIEYSKKLVREKKTEEITESVDVMVYSIVAKEQPTSWIEVKSLVDKFKFIFGQQGDWVNTRWMGRALKRLNLIKEKRRLGQGIQVILDVEKAKKKEAIFKPKKEENDEK